MNKLKEYQKQIVTFITIFLLVNYGIFPGLTMANTFVNIISAIGAGLLIVWGLLEVKSVWDREDEEERIFNEQWKEHVQRQMEEMDKMLKQNEVLADKAKPKKKSNPKQFDGVESDKSFVKTRKKSKPKVTIDFTDAKGMSEVDGVIKPIAEGRVKISVETPKTKRKPKTK